MQLSNKRALITGSTKGITLVILGCILLFVLPLLHAAGPAKQRSWMTPSELPQRPVFLLECGGVSIGTCPIAVVWADGQIMWKANCDGPICPCGWVATQVNLSSGGAGDVIRGFRASGYRRSGIDPALVEAACQRLETLGIFDDHGFDSLDRADRSSGYSVTCQQGLRYLDMDGLHRVVERADSGWVLEYEEARLLEPGETREAALADEPAEFMRHRFAFDVIEREVKALVMATPNVESYPLCGQLLADISALDNDVVMHRVKYDNWVVEFNKVLDERQDEIKTLGKPYSNLKKKSTFQLPE